MVMSKNRVGDFVLGRKNDRVAPIEWNVGVGEAPADTEKTRVV